jgi:hypothetical protein
MHINEFATVNDKVYITKDQDPFGEAESLNYSRYSPYFMEAESRLLS